MVLLCWSAEMLMAVLFVRNCSGQSLRNRDGYLKVPKYVEKILRINHNNNCLVSSTVITFQGFFLIILRACHGEFTTQLGC
jgi:hypothetical protein